MTQKKKHWWENQWFLLIVMILIFLGCIVYLVIKWDYIWESLKGIFDIKWLSLNEFLIVLGILLPFIVTIILFFIRPVRLWIWKTIGEGPPIQHSWFRFIIPFFLFIPFTAILLASKETLLPSLMQFSLIALAPTLGGLVLTAGNRKSLKKHAYNHLLAVAQKLLVSTVLFITFVSLMFLSNIFGGVNLDSLEWSSMGFVRWFLLWSAFLFLLGISDLVLALRLLRK